MTERAELLARCDRLKERGAALLVDCSTSMLRLREQKARMSIGVGLLAELTSVSRQAVRRSCDLRDRRAAGGAERCRRESSYGQAFCLGSVKPNEPLYIVFSADEAAAVLRLLNAGDRTEVVVSTLDGRRLTWFELRVLSARRPIILAGEGPRPGSSDQGA